MLGSVPMSTPTLVTCNATSLLIQRPAVGQVVLVALPGVDLEAVEAELQQQTDALPRSAIARQALAHSCIVRVSGREEAAAFSNRYAPEHLIVNVEDAESWLPLLDNVGSVFLGPWCAPLRPKLIAW